MRFGNRATGRLLVGLMLCAGGVGLAPSPGETIPPTQAEEATTQVSAATTQRSVATSRESTATVPDGGEVVAGVGTGVPTTAPYASAEGEALLKRMMSAVQGLSSYRVRGSFRADIDVMGERDGQAVTFVTTYGAGGLFRHEAKGRLIIGCTGERMYSYKPPTLAMVPNAIGGAEDGASESTVLPRTTVGEYVSVAMPELPAAVDVLPSFVTEIVRTQDPVLLWKLLKDPAAELSRKAVSIERSGASLVLKGADNAVTRVEVDEATGLPRRVVFDLAGVFRARGVPAVKAAALIAEYGVFEPPSGPVAREAFSWTAPEDAVDVTQPAPKAATRPTVVPGFEARSPLVEAGEVGKAVPSVKVEDMGGGTTRPGGAGDAGTSEPGEEVTNPVDLVGRPAPEVTLSSLDGATVKLSSLRGQVVVLDFWATWCAPCPAVMAHSLKLHQDTGAGNQGVKVYGVNVGEKAPKVAKFLDERGLSELPVLLDPSGEASGEFLVGALPMVVVVDKEGVIRAVQLGNVQEAMEKLDALVKELQGK